MASFTSGNFDGVDVDGMLEHLEKERYLKNKFLLVVADGRHHRS